MKKKSKEERQKEKLDWVIREWDCISLDKAKELAKLDSMLHRLLRECGIRF